MRYWIVLAVLIAGVATAAQKIYKTVDADGNVVYTDQRPEEQSTPMDLPDISVVKSKPSATGNTALDRERDRMNKEGATPFSDLQLLEPQPDQTYWGTGGTMSVRVGTETQLGESQTLRYYLDNEAVGSSKSKVMVLTEVFRGTHTVKVEALSGGRVMASAGPVTFHMKQQSKLNPNNPQTRNSNSNSNPPPTPAQINRAQRRALNANRSGGDG